MLDVRIKGAEVTVSSRPARGLEVYAALGTNDSRIEDFNGTGAFDDNQTPTNIRAMLNAGAQDAHVLGKRAVGIVRADIQRRGRQYWAPDNLDVQHPIDVANLRLSVLTGAWSIVGWTKNVGNEKYYVEYGDAGAGIVSGDDIGWPGRPRTFGLEVTRKF